MSMLIALAVVAFLWAHDARAAVTVSVNPSTTYQTIEGFGAHGPKSAWWSGGPFYDDQFLSLIVDDLGLTISRNEFYPDFEPTNENSDVNALEMARFNYSGAFGSNQKAFVNALKAKAVASGEPLRFIATYWSPPSWMKMNNNTTGTDATVNRLRSTAREELGEFGVATVRAYKEQCGVDLYALSMQNEPAFPEPYNSCVYSPDEYLAAFKVFAARVHAAYPNVKLFGAEHMLGNWGTFEGKLASDSMARSHIAAFAVHGYVDGVNPTPSSQVAAIWRRPATNTASAGKALWMTETSGNPLTWSGSFSLAKGIFGALKFGKIAAWVWWSLGEYGGGDGYSLVDEGVPTKHYYVSKQYYRYIRPGAVMVEATADDSLVFAAAFKHAANRTMTVVLVNENATARTVAISGAGLPQSYTMYQTTASENCANKGSVNASAVTLPASSIATLVAQNYDVSAVEAGFGSSSLSRSPRTAAYPGGQFALDGRRLSGRAGSGMDSKAATPGVYIGMSRTGSTLVEAVGAR